MQTFRHLDNKPFLLYTGEGLLPRVPANFQAYILGLITLEAVTFELREALGGQAFAYTEHIEYVIKAMCYNPLKKQGMSYSSSALLGRELEDSITRLKMLK
jgi:hypothetical protein